MFHPVEESYLVKNDEPLNTNGPMPIVSSIRLAHIGGYDHEAGIFETYVWQVPKNAKPGELYYVGYFASEIELICSVLNSCHGGEVEVFWNVIKIVVAEPDRSSHYSF